MVGRAGKIGETWLVGALGDWIRFFFLFLTFLEKVSWLCFGVLVHWTFVLPRSGRWVRWVWCACWAGKFAHVFSFAEWERWGIVVLILWVLVVVILLQWYRILDHILPILTLTRTCDYHVQFYTRGWSWSHLGLHVSLSIDSSVQSLSSLSLTSQIIFPQPEFLHPQHLSPNHPCQEAILKNR